jgi:hypothetical protein
MVLLGSAFDVGRVAFHLTPEEPKALGASAA